MSFLSLLFPSQKQEAPEITPELKPVCAMPYYKSSRTPENTNATGPVI